MPASQPPPLIQRDIDQRSPTPRPFPLHGITVGISSQLIQRTSCRSLLWAAATSVAGLIVVPPVATSPSLRVRPVTGRRPPEPREEVTGATATWAAHRGHRSSIIAWRRRSGLVSSDLGKFSTCPARSTAACRTAKVRSKNMTSRTVSLKARPSVSCATVQALERFKEHCGNQMQTEVNALEKLLLDLASVV
ncbi:hypothetical protein Purlil1_12165 [Purpureocillium lilacinum]|uniref:Uncharacterized protein n=1 Tax=Purpureocillium lilacinum TaxID=33203 RepID=A0ABR0BHS3_PURLI|nr:hypothetical protein Purlil1_12165 [Purpureocillium lilacinum]